MAESKRGSTAVFAEQHRFRMDNNKDITQVLVGIHVWPTCSSVINYRIHLSEGIGRVIKCEQTLPRGIAFQKGASRLDRCTSVKHYGSIE
ncbi:hypothetical protein ALC57_02325 [Trachymyrmex cornetzi]|uniref:Uncharacterized protein n=1 Tax=Trachymyrmex cornetzi TaxID=471704 RepID=A0A195EK75_9HYME|nr:hypothetical protein ALC57_02325 [Trachymyrmex cornetzi]